MIKVRIKKVPKARTGYQVQGALVNDVPAMGGADYNAYIGKPQLKESKYIKAVPRDEANLEAEGGETVYGDINGDGMPEHQIIVGPRHAQGGVPLNLPEDTFIFSDTRAMRIKDPQLLTMFGKGGTNKSYTPAELAKQYDVQKYRKILEDPETDAIERKTAELMLKKYVVKLGCLALAQESMKGFPQGIPAVAKPCMEARGLTEEDILPSKEVSVLNDQLKKQMQQQEGGDENMLQEAEEMNDGQPVAQAQEMGAPQEQMGVPSPEEMMMYGGGYTRRLRRAQEGMQQPSPEEMAMMQQQGQAPQQGGQDEMAEVIQEVAAALKRGADPSEVVMSLLQNNIPPDAIVQIFTQLGAEPQQAAGIVQQVMTQAQGGGQEQMMQQQPRVPESMSSMQGGGFTPNWTISDPNNVIPKIDPKTNWVTRPSFINKSEDNSLDAILMRQLENPEGLPQLTPEMIQSLTEEAPAEPIQIPQQQYGGYMELGGYDMPFYDMPEAAYGMAMGSGMSQNYQGRPKRIPGSGPITGMVKAQDGIEVPYNAAWENDPAAREQALRLAYAQARKKGKDTKIYVVKDGKKIEQKVSPTRYDKYSGADLASGWNNNQVAAATYEAMKQTFNDPKAKAAFAKQVRDTLGEKASYKGKTPGKYSETYQSKFGKDPSDPSQLSDEEIVEKYLRMQERNLKTTTIGDSLGIKGYGTHLYTDFKGDLRQMEDVDKDHDGIIKPNSDEVGFKSMVKNTAAGKDLSDAEIEAMRKKIKDAGYTSLEAVSDKVGLPMKRAVGTGRATNPYDEEAYIQQAGFIAADKLMKDLDANPGNYDDETSTALLGISNFAGFSPYGMQVGVSDEAGMGTTNISPIDAYYTNTTQGEIQGIHGLKFEDIPDTPGVGPCQCEKDKLADGSPDPSYKPKDAQGNCTCKPTEPKKCPCQKADGTVLEMTANADGSCPPCTEDKDLDIPGPPAEWWLQDTIKTTGAFGDLMGVKKYMPWAPPAKLQTPRPTFLDPTRELAANAEQANIQTQGMAQFAGPQALSARSSGIQGQAAKNAADVLSKYNNANVNIANQFEMKATDIRNQESMLNQATQQRLYDQNTVANQQFDNAKLAMRNNLRNYYTNAITNRTKTDALNQMFENYRVSPGSGGFMDYRPTEKTTNPSGSSTDGEWEAAFKFCKENGDPNPSACANRKVGVKSKTNSGADPNMINTMYGRDGGQMFEDGGYVYIDSWLPFIM